MNTMYRTTTLFSLLMGLLLCPSLASAQMIWPGDINNNGIVNGVDYLYWGIASQTAGPNRPDATTEWEEQAMGTSWTNTFPESTNYAYADANGDGQVNANDSELIANHFLKNHGTISPDVYQQSYDENAPPIRFEFEDNNLQSGELKKAIFTIGDNDSQAFTDFYGFTFVLTYPAMALEIDNGLSFGLYSEALLNRSNNNIAIYIHNDPINGRAEITMVRTDGQPVEGYGKVGVFLFQFADLTSAGIPPQINFELVDLMAIDVNMNPIEMQPTSFSFSYGGEGGDRNCPLYASPVCGINGVTYLNSCFAEAAGVFNYTAGTCFDDSCIDPALMNPTAVCPTVYEPVCGCNGVTYTNECAADAAGVVSTTPGSCSTNNNNCYDPQYVVTSTSTSVNSYTGVITTDCTALYDPVCGCNGVTYANACLAEASGITVYTQGSCESVCIDPYQMDWDAVCTTEYDPVCGCNGVTYTNACRADAAGVVNYTNGPCGGTSAWCEEAIPIQCGDFLPYETTIGAGNNILQYPGCSNTTFLGADRVYVIQKESAGDLQIGLEILTANLDLDMFLLFDNCSQLSCLASSTTSNAVTNNEGIVLEDAPIGTYYIVIDGQYANSQGNFRLEVSCGYLYCGDAVDLQCGQTYNGSNLYGHDDVSLYYCDNNVLNVENNGPEIVHTFTQTQAGPVNISLTGLSANLELFLLRSCDRGDCMEYSQHSGNANEYISAYLPAGIYYIVVDGYNGSVSDYSLLVNCNSSCDLSLIGLSATSSGCGQTSGTIQISTTGGQPYYLISYSGPLSGSFTTASNYSTISNLPPGTYTVTKTDAQGCSVSGTVTILGGGNLSVNLTPNDAVCMSLGSIGVSISNGQAPYSIYLSGPTGGSVNVNANNFTINDLAPGDYTIHITDYAGCSVSQQLTIEQSSGDFIWNYEVTPAACGGYGAVHINTYNGVYPYNILVSGPVSGGATVYSSSFNLINLPGGVYQITVEDGNWCLVTQTVIIPDANLNIDLNATAGICGQNGSIIVNISNGSGSYTINWQGPVSGSVQTNSSQYVLPNLPSGNYTVSVQDDAGCTDYQAITVSNGEEGGLDFAVIPLPGSCGQNGALWIDIFNGSPVYTVSWSGPASGILTTDNDGLDIPNLPCGTYQVVITDINGCSASQTVVLGGCSDMDVDLTPTNGICGQNGSILVNINGGSPVYTVSWTGTVSGQTTTNTNVTNITNLPAGTYTIGITDANGCTAYAATQVNTLESNLVITTTVTQADCGSSGAININLSGGTGPYQISWSGPESGSMTSPTSSISIANLTAGTYQIYATDVNGCSDNATVIITNQNSNLVVSLVGNDGVCSQYGNIGVYVSNGNGPYIITWSGPVNGSASFAGTVFQIPNVPVGLYNVVVTDANGCSASDAVQINIQNILNAYITPYDGQCGINGSIQVNIVEGTPGYTISWSGPVSGSINTVGQQYTISNLPQGDYTVVVVDANGCSRTMNTNIQHTNDGLSIVTALIYNACGQYNTIWIDIIGGTAPYTIIWTGTENGSATTNSDGFEIIDLPPGTYKVTVIDSNGCMDMEQDIIVYPAPVDLFTVTPFDGVCGEDGYIQVNINGGTGPYVLNWNGPVSGTQNYVTEGVYILSNMPTGTYTFTILDANWCTATQTVVLGNGGSPVEIITALIYNECGQYNTIWVDIVGGTSPYTITWTGTENGSNTVYGNGFEIEDLPPGTYKVTVIDSNGCMDMQQDIIIYPAPINLFEATPINGVCGEAGKININVINGTAPFLLTYFGPISGSQTVVLGEQLLTGFPSGTYTLILTDANNCTETEIVVLDNGSGDVVSITTALIYNECGQYNTIWVDITGGTPPYTYTWIGTENGSGLTNSNGFEIEDLPPGSYKVIVTDANGCMDMQQDIIVYPAPVNLFEAIPINGICNELGSIQVNILTGSPIYNLSWSGPISGSAGFSDNTYTIPGLPAGIYTLTLEDDNSCTEVEVVTVSTSEGNVFLVATPHNETCISAASISVQAFGGDGSYTLSWSGPESGSANIGTTYVIDDLLPGFYILTLNDGNGCSDTEQISISVEEDNLNISLIPYHGICGSNGNITVNINGSQPPYTVTWTGPDNGSSTTNNQYFNIPNLSAGVYTVQVVGSDGCFATQLVQLNDQNGNINVSASPINGVCGNNGSIGVTLSGGLSTYTLQWSGPVSGSTIVSGNTYVITNLPDGTYIIQVNSGTCTANTTTTIYNGGNNISIWATPNNGTCSSSSSINVLLAGGTAPYQLSWQGPQNGSTVVNGNSYSINDIPEGFYTLFVVDANGCSRSTNVSLSNNDLDIGLVPQNGVCGDNASISLTINYGVAPFTISWTGLVDGFVVSESSSYTIQYLPGGTYQVTVQDANGCEATVTTSVTTTPTDISFAYNVGNSGCGAFDNIWMDFYNGVLPYTISWTGPTSGSVVTYNDWYDIQNIPSGSYTVILSDANGCVYVRQVEVNNIVNNLDIELTPIPGSCGGNGSIGVSIQGGDPTYTIAWYLNDQAVGEIDINGNFYNIPNLASGNYFIRITDENECLQTAVVNLVNSANNLYVATSVTSPSCSSAGSIGLIMAGGQTPYQLSWSGPVPGNASVNDTYYIIGSLTGGTYQVTVTDANGCGTVLNIDVPGASQGQVVADFIYTVDGLTVTFESLSSNDYHVWNFGDGGSAAYEQNPVHAFSAPGSYQVCLGVSGNCGYDEYCLTIELTAEGETVILDIGEGSGAAGSIISLPVTLHNAENIVSITGTIQVANASVADILSATPGVISPQFNTINNTFSYFAGDGNYLTFNDDDVLFYLNVLLTGNIGETTLLEFINYPLTVEVGSYVAPSPIAIPVTTSTGSASITNMLALGGQLTTYWGDGVMDAEVTISSTDYSSSMMTNESGNYAMPSLNPGASYTVSASKNVAPDNGLSSYALYIGQRFLLGFNPSQIVSPYQIIAGDANCNDAFTTQDLFLIQRLIIGEVAAFNSCPSWVFVSDQNNMPIDFDAYNLFPYASSSTMLLTESETVNFVGVKVGDILGQANPDNLGSATDNRTNGILPFTANNPSVSAGELVTLYFSSNDFEDIVSYQFGLEFPANQLEFLSFDAAEETPFQTVVAGYNNAPEGKLRLSWFSTDGQGHSASDETTLFSLRFRALADIADWNGILRIDPTEMLPEAYDANETSLALELSFEEIVTNVKNPLNRDFELYQNTPNPFNESTSIGFYLPESSDVILSLRDALGRVVWQQQAYYGAGEQQFVVDRSSLAAGVYYYTLKADTHMATKAMVVIN